MAAKLMLTKEARAELLAVMRTPITVTEACALVGIGRSTFYDWMARGKLDEEPFAALLQDVERARAQGTRQLLELAEAQAVDDPGQVRYLLGIRNPRAYGRDPADRDGDLCEGVGAERQLELVAANPRVQAAVLAHLRAAEKRLATDNEPGGGEDGEG